MISRTPACLSGVLGGACWIARYAADLGGLAAPDGQLGTALRWAGATWLVLALLSGGAGLVRRAALWLRLLIGVSVLVLAAIALSLLYPATGRLLGDAVFGAGTLLVSLWVWARGDRGRSEDQAAHAAT